MAFMSNQWLRNEYRNKGHQPVNVDCVPRTACSGFWCENHQIIAKLHLSRGCSHAFQVVYFSQDDVDWIVRMFAREVSDATADAIAIDLLTQCSPDGLLTILKKVLEKQ
jgi:hypothetical protein